MKENKIYLLKGTDGAYSVFLPGHDWAKQPFVLLTSDVDTALSFNYTQGVFSTEAIKDLYVLKDNGTLLKCGPTFTEAESLNLTQIQGGDNPYLYSNEYETVFGWYKKVIAGELKELYVLGYYAIDDETKKPKLQPLSSRPYRASKIVVSEEKPFSEIGKIIADESKTLSEIGTMALGETSESTIGVILYDTETHLSKLGDIYANDEKNLSRIGDIIEGTTSASDVGKIKSQDVDKSPHKIGTIASDVYSGSSVMGVISVFDIEDTILQYWVDYHTKEFHSKTSENTPVSEDPEKENIAN